MQNMAISLVFGHLRGLITLLIYYTTIRRKNFINVSFFLCSCNIMQNNKVTVKLTSKNRLYILFKSLENANSCGVFLLSKRPF